MNRLTYENKDGSWGLKGVSWDQLAALPPRVYGALAKLKDLETQVDEAGDQCGRNTGGGGAALKALGTVKSGEIQTGTKGAVEWYRKRFETVT